jgi:hypothetical protein
METAEKDSSNNFDFAGNRFRIGQGVILAYWKTSKVPQIPIFELSNLWSDSEANFAQVGDNGMLMRFSFGDFAVFPNTIALWVIAHELAHVYQKAIGRVPGGISELENETDANRIAAEWGFEQRPLVMLKLLTQGGLLSVGEASKGIAQMGTA